MDSPAADEALLIAWHSRTGASEQMAYAAAKAASEHINTELVAAQDVQPDLIVRSSGYLFVCPENLGTVSGTMKEMFDRCYYPVLGQIEGRAFGTLIAAGSDGEGAQRQIERIATGWRLQRKVPPVIVNMQAQTPEEICSAKTVPETALQRCRETAAMLGAGLTMGLF